MAADDQVTPAGITPQGEMNERLTSAGRFGLLRLFARYALMGNTVRRALKVAAVVTPILTLLNHSAELLALQLDRRFWLQAALTFFVPYLVSTYSSAMAAMQEHRRMSIQKQARTPFMG